jgi:hypothetical protein
MRYAPIPVQSAPRIATALSATEGKSAERVRDRAQHHVEAQLVHGDPPANQGFPREPTLEIERGTCVPQDAVATEQRARAARARSPRRRSRGGDAASEPSRLAERLDRETLAGASETQREEPHRRSVGVRRIEHGAPSAQDAAKRRRATPESSTA